jgi:hypothetical protein
LIALSLYEIIINGDIKVFKDSESEKILVPHKQVEYVVEKLFGSDKKIKAENIEVEGIEIKYDKKNLFIY